MISYQGYKFGKSVTMARKSNQHSSIAATHVPLSTNLIGCLTGFLLFSFFCCFPSAKDMMVCLRTKKRPAWQQTDQIVPVYLLATEPFLIKRLQIKRRKYQCPNSMRQSGLLANNRGPGVGKTPFRGRNNVMGRCARRLPWPLALIPSP